MSTRPDFDEWVSARGPSLLRLAYVLTGSREDANDLVEETLSQALARWSRISRHSDPDAYVRRMVVHANASRWRRFRRQHRPAPPPPDAVLTTGVAIEDHDDMWRACRSLPPDQRTAVVLRFYQGLDYAEIAEMTGGREGSVRSRVSRGVTALRAELEQSRA